LTCSRNTEATIITQKNAKPVSTAKKSELIKRLLKRANGAVIVELSKAKDHDVRGFMSGTAKKKLSSEEVSRSEVDKDRRDQGAVIWRCMANLWLVKPDGGAKGNRTPDLVIANDALYQLSYRP
jgi:hypothetical protein